MALIYCRGRHALNKKTKNTYTRLTL